MNKEKQIEILGYIIEENSPLSKMSSQDLAEVILQEDYHKQSEGEWISLEPSIGLYTCSLCDHRILRAKCNYCPNCGAKMKEGETE